MNNSAIQSKIWRWRQGLRQLPLHSGSGESQTTQKRELYLDVANPIEQKKVMKELEEQGIRVESKRTHSRYDEIPAGTLIVYASTSFNAPLKHEQENIEKLKNYIILQQGKIMDCPFDKPKIGLFARLFKLGR